MARQCAKAQFSKFRIFHTIAMVIAPALMMGPASAQVIDDKSRDAVIGTFRLGAQQGTKANGPTDAPHTVGAGQRQAEQKTGPSDPVGDLYERALEALSAGQKDEALRSFERVVALGPTSRYAALARQHLAELYRDSYTVQAGPDDTENQSATFSLRGKDEGTSQKWSPALAGPEAEMEFIASAGDRVFFSAGSAELGGRASAVLQAQARWLKGRPDFKVLVEGHADDAPLDEQQSMALSQRRAEVVYQRLIELGVTPNRLKISAFGRDRRLAVCDSALCSAQNRRVVTAIRQVEMRSNQSQRLNSVGSAGVPVASDMSRAQPW